MGKHSCQGVDFSTSRRSFHHLEKLLAYHRRDLFSVLLALLARLLLDLFRCRRNLRDLYDFLLRLLTQLLKSRVVSRSRERLFTFGLGEQLHILGCLWCAAADEIGLVDAEVQGREIHLLE
jgi:hypothetical protein